MKLNGFLFVMIAAVLVLSVGVVFAQEMTKEQWQQEVNKVTGQRNEASAKVKAAEGQVATMKTQSTQLDADQQKCMDELYALVGATKEQAAAYRTDVAAAEAKANELMRLSDADLVARASEVTELETTTKGLWGNKLSLVPEFWDKLTALDSNVKSLQATLEKQVKVYTVGTWAKDRDCLWNISKKKDIYDNAWMWPKIWQGNRDQIKDPDVIHQGQMLKIPKEKEMTAEEKAAARKYYARKAAAPAPAAAPAQAPPAK